MKVPNLKAFPLLSHPITTKIGLGLLFLTGVMLISLTLFSPYRPQNLQLSLGDIANKTIISPRYIELETTADKQFNDKEILTIKDQAKTVYTINTTVNNAILTDINTIFDHISDEHLEKITQKISEKNPSLNYLSASTISAIAQLPKREFSSLKFITLEIAQNILNEGIQQKDPDQLKTKLNAYLDTLSLRETQVRFITDTLIHTLRPNKMANSEETEKLLAQQLAQFHRKKTILKDGDPIIYKGEVVTASHLDMLKAVNLYGRKANIIQFFGIIAIVTILLIIIERFIYTFKPSLHTQKKVYVLILMVVLLSTGLGLLSLNLPQNIPILHPYILIPIPLSSLLVSILISPHIAMLTGTVISLMIAIMFEAELPVFIFLFTSNCSACFISYRKYSRNDLTKSGYLIGLTNMVLVIAIGLLTEMTAPLWYITSMGIGFINGVMSAMITLAILPYLETLFRISTPQTLLELSNLNHPIMKKLMINAPGTYQHSLMVANLAEAAAEAIQADPILSRVGSYYHDIGKLKRPMFFTENQYSNENPHDTLSPKMSQMIIASHTKDGVELAKKYKLPKILQDIMMEHHGTSLVSFFYQKAIQTGSLDETTATDSDYRYSGPKPQSKVSGIIMLADSVEAAVRALQKPSLSKIETLIEKIFQTKIEDNQLSEAPLTLAEIHIIKTTFLSMFKGIYHNRLNYQEEIRYIIESSSKPSKKKQADH